MLPASSEHRSAIDTIAQRSSEPLRVAVAGRLKSGKSTLVNALLGQRVAPVAGTECTRVVTIFRYGAREQVRVTPKQGKPWSVALTADGRLPEELGAAPDSIANVTAWLSNRTLQHVTLIDTPGLDSPDAATSAATEALLGLDEESTLHVRGADALIFLLPHLLDQDQARLERFARQLGNTASSPTTTLAVLSRVDQLGTEADPWPQARSTAAVLQDELARAVFSVLPVVGLLAETAAADAFTEDDANALRRLAELPRSKSELLLLSVDDFVETPVEVGVERRRRLLDLLGFYGVRRAITILADDGGLASSQLIGRLAAESGFDRVERAVNEVFLRRSEALRASIQIDGLERISYQLDRETEREGAELLRSELPALRLDPTLHAAREVEALGALRQGRFRLAVDDLAAAEALLTGVGDHERLQLPDSSPSDRVASLALEETARWQRIENDPRSDRATRDLASTLRTSLMGMWEAAHSP